MLNDLLGIIVQVLLGYIITPIFNFFDSALFGGHKDPLA